MSEIQVRADGTVSAYVGADATQLLQVKLIARGLKMYNETGMILARNGTPSQLLKLASHYSGKKYANSAKGRTEAAADMQARADLLLSSLPVVQR